MQERPLSWTLQVVQNARKTLSWALQVVQNARKTSFWGFARFLKYILCSFHLVCLLYE